MTSVGHLLQTVDYFSRMVPSVGWFLQRDGSFSGIVTSAGRLAFEDQFSDVSFAVRGWLWRRVVPDVTWL